MGFICPMPMVDGSEVRGMLNIEGRVFPVAAEVRHCNQCADGYEIGVVFRHLHAEERELLAGLAGTGERGRRGEELTGPPDTEVPGTVVTAVTGP